MFAALCVGAGAWGLSRIAGWPPWRTAAYAFVVAASHGLLDTLTFGGGLGCELLWPFSTARFWSPVRLIPIAPIGAGLFSRYGLWVMLAEGVLFSPFWLYAVMRRPRA